MVPCTISSRTKGTHLADFRSHTHIDEAPLARTIVVKEKVKKGKRHELLTPLPSPCYCPGMSALRIRTGVAKKNDGWHVIVDRGEGIEYTEPAFETEHEARNKAQLLSSTIRARLRKEGIPHV